MSIIIDAIVVIILAGSVYRGYKKGIVDIGFKLFAFIISLLIALILFSPITNFVINNTNIDEKIEQIIKENAGAKKEDNKSDSSKSSGIDAYIQNYSKELAKDAQNNIVETAAKPIAKNVIGIGVMIILFIGTRIILTILKTFTDIIAKLPLIKQFNEVAGLIYGLLIGLIIIYAILAITFFVLSVSGDQTINTLIESSYVTKFFYNNNLILKILF